VTITSSIVAPHGPLDVPVNVSRVVAPALGASDVPSVFAAHSIFIGVWGGLLASNVKLWLVDPKATLSPLSAGEKAHANGSVMGLPARANVTEYTCPG
jgi:hypothetical protein